MQRGFTLIELLVYIVILTIVFSALASLTVVGIRMERNRSALDDIRHNGVSVLNRLEEDVRLGNSISSPSTGSSGQTLSIITDSGSITYTVSGGFMYRNSGSGAVPISSSDVEVIEHSFSNRGAGAVPDIVTVSITLSGTKTDLYEEVFTTSINVYE